MCKASVEKNAICYRAIGSNGELGSVEQLQTQRVVPRMSVPQIAKVANQLLFVWTDKGEDQYQINSKFVSLDSVNGSIRLTHNR